MAAMIGQEPYPLTADRHPWLAVREVQTERPITIGLPLPHGAAHGYPQWDLGYEGQGRRPSPLLCRLRADRRAVWVERRSSQAWDELVCLENGTASLGLVGATAADLKELVVLLNELAGEMYLAEAGSCAWWMCWGRWTVEWTNWTPSMVRNLALALEGLMRREGILERSVSEWPQQPKGG